MSVYQPREVDGRQKTEKVLHQYNSIGSENGRLIISLVDDKIKVTRGCFIGSLQEFEDAVEKTHGDNPHGRTYKKIIECLKLEYPDYVKAGKWYVMLEKPAILSASNWSSSAKFLNKTPSGSFMLGSSVEESGYQTTFSSLELKEMDTTGFRKIKV